MNDNIARRQCAIVNENRFAFVFFYLLLVLFVFMRIWRWVKFFYAEEELERVRRVVRDRSSLSLPPAYDEAIEN